MKFLVTIICILSLSVSHAQNTHVFEALPYKYDALEPHIDAKTVEIHYDKHHRGYYNNFLNAIKGTPAEKMSLEQILKNISSYSTSVRNNGGGWYNHTLYWNIMAIGGSKTPQGKLLKQINETFGNYDALKKQISDKAMQRFGSGWAWLIVSSDGSLIVSSTEYQDNPLMNTVDIQGIPILGIDVWEHAYYLKYQNMRKNYVDAFWELINWDVVEKYYNDALIQMKK
jgi:Fe-Mn family superoxide dismutase